MISPFARQHVMAFALAPLVVVMVMADSATARSRPEDRLSDLQAQVRKIPGADATRTQRGKLEALLGQASSDLRRLRRCSALRTVDGLRASIRSPGTWRSGNVPVKLVARLDRLVLAVDDRLVALKATRTCATRSQRRRTLPAVQVEGAQYPARTLPAGDLNDEGEPRRVPRGTFRPQQQPERSFELSGQQASTPGAVAADAADPLKLFVNTDLGARPSEFPETTPIDPTAASAGDLVVFTGNDFLAFSKDSGALGSFTYLNPTKIFKTNPDGGFNGDQQVQYDPGVDRFIWLSQYRANAANENRYRIAVASPDQLRTSGGTAWRYVDLTSKQLGLPGQWMDRPDMTIGGDSLLITADAVPNTGALWLRLSLAALAKVKTGDSPAFDQQFISKGFFMAAVQNSTSRAYTAWNTSQSSLEVRYWDEASDISFPQKVEIKSIPTESCVSTTPAGFDWLLFGGCPGGLPRWAVTGATRRADELWLAWGAGRRYAGQTKNTFAQPHIELAVVRTDTFKVARQEVLHNPDFALAYPALGTNLNGEVGMAFHWGGNMKYYANDGVALLTGVRRAEATVLGSQGGGRYGDYLSVRPHSPNGRLFSAAGFVTTTPNPPGYYHSQWTLFGRQGDFVPSAPLGGKPDLVVTELTKDRWTVANVGGSKAGKFSVRLEHPNPGIGSLTWNFSGLAAGDSLSREFFCYAGLRSVVADSEAEVPEAQEANNGRKLKVPRCID